MRRLLKSPVVNAICISLFTVFYVIVFCIASRSATFQNALTYSDGTSFLSTWGNFLAEGHQIFIVLILVAVTILNVILLVTRRRLYDEYHISILADCLVASVALTFASIAIFYVLVLIDPSGIIEKFTLFIVIHWATVVFANLAYVLLCRRK